MANFLLGRNARANSTNGPDTQLRFTTAQTGDPVPICWGQCRVAAHVIWYGDFVYTNAKSQGGKGGVLNPSGKGSSGSYDYTVSVAFAFCEGPIAGIEGYYLNSTNPPPPLASGETYFGGDYVQGTWGWLDSYQPSQSLNYRGTHYIGIQSLDLGSSSSLPNVAAEVLAGLNHAIPGYPDANPADVVEDFLLSASYGVPGFTSDLLADLTPYRTYCLALSLGVSQALTDQTAAQSFLNDLMTATNSEFVWSGEQLKIVPYCDTPVSGNGVTYTPDMVPVYDLTTADFMPNQGTVASTSGDTSLVVTRLARAQMTNSIRLEYLDRGMWYNTNIVEVRDEAAIELFGLMRPSDTTQAHMFCAQAIATVSAGLQLHRAQIAASYQFTLAAWAILLEPMDIVTLTEPQLGLDRQAVRIMEIQENDDGSLTFTCDEVPYTLGAPEYGQQASIGGTPNYNVDPGPAAAPVIFEPPYLLAQELAVAVAVCGTVTATWGGAHIWVSTDDASYELAGTVYGPARMGVTTDALPAVTPAASGATVDSVHVLDVSLAESDGALASGSASDMLAGNTACYLDGEVIAYQTATLTAANQYALAPLARGLYDTTIGAHAAGVPIVRLDAAVFDYPYTQDRIGQTIYLKFQSFNVYGGGVEQLSSVGAVPYTITGSPLKAAVATPQNLRTVFSAAFQQLWWDEVTDFRSGLRYAIYRGDSFASALQLATLAHPPYQLAGDGTYYVVATVQPLPNGFIVASPPASLAIAGTMLVANALVSFDEQAESWPGTRTNLKAQATAPFEILALVPGLDYGAASDAVSQSDDFGLASVAATVDLDFGTVTS